MKIRGFYFIIVIFVMTLSGCKQGEYIRLAGKAQGTYYSIVYCDRQQRNFTPQVDSLLNDFDLTASLWVDSSEICRFNQCADSMIVSERFADLFRKSEYTREVSDGAFDCRVGQLVSAYGFARRERRELSEAEIDSLLTVCRARVWLDTTSDGTLMMHKENAATCIDFNAIAQGYSVDLLIEMFRGLGVKDCLIDVGGEVRGIGSKAGGEPWVVGVERPAASRDDERAVEVAVPLNNQSIVTSGSYRKYYEHDGIRYSHTIDPATGRPVGHTTLSASVIADEAWLADALATAMMVMGYERGREWLKKHNDVDAFFIYDSAGQNQHYATPRFESMILK